MPWKIALTLAAAVAAFVVVNPLVQQSVQALIAGGLFMDDAFFYSVIAERIAGGGAPSLDGIHVTNGFQPLWMLLLSLLNVVFPAVPSTELLSLASFACIVLAASIFTFWALRDLRISVLAPVAFGLLLYGLLNPAFLDRVLNGLETPLLVLMLGIWLVAAGEGMRKTPA